MAEAASGGMRAKGPVFVAGCPRSGTSALSWAIAAHPGYWTSAETHFFYYLLRNGVPTLTEAFERSSEPGQWLHKHGIDLPTFQSYLGDLTSAQSALPLLYEIDFSVFLEYLGHGFGRMMRTHSGGLQWIDGSPENILVGDLLLQMFPTSSMFIVVRDPRSVCYSMLTSGFDTPWASDLDAAIREWTHYAQVGRTLAAVHPDRTIEIRQEEMRASPDAVAAVISERLSLDEPSRVAEFLGTRTVNSSLDRSTYAPASPFRQMPASELSRQEFLDRHAARIMRDTAELAQLYGYE